MPLGRRQLFVYWRVAPADLPSALEALREWQAGLVDNHPALRCGLYRRSDGAEAQATVMESYALESAGPHDGIDDTLHAYIVESGRNVLQRWLSGARHVEVFDALHG
jgi:hypothetical protein